MSNKGYFEDKNEDKIPDGWMTAYNRMLGTDANKNGYPDSLDPFVRKIELEVRTMIWTFMAGGFLMVLVGAIIGWLFGKF